MVRPFNLFGYLFHWEVLTNTRFKSEIFLTNVGPHSLEQMERLLATTGAKIYGNAPIH